jgi:hypothetical protein
MGQFVLGAWASGLRTAPKQADQQVGKAFLLALFGLGGERSQGENGLLARECLVHQVRAVAVQARQQANPLRNTFRCLEHGMEIVFVQQLGAAVVQHFRVDDAAFQRGLESSRAGAGGIKRRGLIGVPDFAVFAHVEPGEGKDDTEFVAPPGERRGIASVVHRVHRTVDEHDEMVADLVVVLRTGQCIEQPLPLGDAGRCVSNLDFLQQPLDLCAAQTALGIGEHAARSFKML